MYSANSNITTFQQCNTIYEHPHTSFHIMVYLLSTEVSFFSLAYIDIRTSTFRQTMCQTRLLFSSLSVLTAATPTINCTMNHSVHQKTTGYSSQVISSGPSDNVQGTLPFIRKQQGFLFFTSSSNGNHTNHKRYSEPIRPQENNRVFFTSNSNGVSPIRRSTLNHSVH